MDPRVRALFHPYDCMGTPVEQVAVIYPHGYRIFHCLRFILTACIGNREIVSSNEHCEKGERNPIER